MKVRLHELRVVINEVLEGQARVNRLRAIGESNRPYLRGQWVKVGRPVGQRARGDCWEADDPELGKVYLTFSTDVHYKNFGTSMIRDAGHTRHTYKCILSFDPFVSYAFLDSSAYVINAVVTGESREREVVKQDQVSRKMMKLFDIDPYAWLRPKTVEPVKTQAPAPAPMPATLDEPVVTEPTTEPAPSSPASGEKTYKVYGRKGSAPAHTRYKGKAYVAGQGTKFKAGDQAVVAPKDGKLNVKDPSSDHNQEWEPE